MKYVFEVVIENDTVEGMISIEAGKMGLGEWRLEHCDFVDVVDGCPVWEVVVESSTLLSEEVMADVGAAFFIACDVNEYERERKAG